MALWKISTLNKKSVVDQWLFTKDGDSDKWVKVEEIWRWGYVIVDSDEPPVFGSNEDGFDVYDYDVYDQQSDDGVGTWFEYSESVTEDEREEFENLFYEGFEELMEAGWSDDESAKYFMGEVAVELYENIHSR